ncbi:transmembrane protein [Stemphylium lycopersici]|uniref:ER membrane protein complex subunit 3 n=1 Tax=Stemphylium lycopersici TaxID=183478 RepID=A0A364NET3_STELY|nr:transmembrane protein [Stemphylium lycopersici]RAR06553.1 transmembrane protein [Stemphylium lycopersici]RAR15835.1 transmembrane protein [Stemphylium lycopersici]
MGQPVVQTIHRDPALFWWILLPITVVMVQIAHSHLTVPPANNSIQVLTGILRHYAMTLLQSAPKKHDLPKIRQQRSLIRGVNLRTNAQVISPSSFATRKAYMVQAYQEGKFLAEPELRGKPRPNPMSDPAAMEGMMGMMKGQMTMMIPQTLIMGWINAFFSGFVIMKLPFPLTPQFKSMLQSGVGTRDLDVRWVSSLSWYFLTLFGLQPVYNFILGSNNCQANSASLAANQVQQQMAMANPGAGGMMGPEQDPDKLFLSEAENLEVLEHRWILEGIEDRLVAKLGA